MDPNHRTDSPMSSNCYIARGTSNNNQLSTNNYETKVCIVVDSRGPITIRIPLPPERVTLADFKMASGLNYNNALYKYFFKTEDSDFGIVKEEISDDFATLPMFKGRIVAWVLTKNIASMDRQEHSGPLGSYFSESSLSLNSSDNNSNRHQHLSIYDKCGHAESSSNISESTSFLDYDLSEDDITLADSSRYSQSTCRQCDMKINHRANHDDKTNQSYRNIYNRPSRNNNDRNGAHFNLDTNSSMSNTKYMNLVTVQLNLNDFNLLGIVIVGKSNENNIDGGIYVGEIKNNSVVAQDGRIESGDMLVRINNVNIMGMTNKRAVEILREAVQKSGPLRLVVAKCQSVKSRGHFTVAHDQVFSLIDTAAWVANSAKQSTHATDYPNRYDKLNNNTIRSSVLPTCATTPRPSSAVDETTGSSNMRKFNIRLGGSLRSYDRCSLSPTMHKDKIDIIKVVQRMMLPTSGLEVKDREWLKITVPKAFLGSDVIQWLEKNVSGFQNRREIKNYASRMLELGYFRDLIASKSFSEKCYYVFANNILYGRVTSS